MLKLVSINAVFDNRYLLRLHFINLLKNLSAHQFCGCVQGESNALTWRIYFEQGKISYATHSIAAYERLKRHLYRLSNNLRLVSAVSALQKEQKDSAIACWLVEHRLVSPADARVLVSEIVIEVLESLLLSPLLLDISYTCDRLPLDCQLELHSLLAECQARLEDWQRMRPAIASPFQRPVLVERPSLGSDRRLVKLKKVLTGFNFRQLAALLHQDERLIAQRMQPLIAQNLIALKAPQPPFDRMPTLISSSQDKAGDISRSAPRPLSPPLPVAQHTVVCVDDSPAAMGQIEEFLRELNLSFIKFSDPVKALLAISKIQPDLILLDVGMPNIDGYSLCSLLRKNSLLRSTPIVMVTGYQGEINKTKANFVGATDYLTKPFTQSELAAVVLKHVNIS